MYLVSICVPTYKRVEYLLQSLDILELASRVSEVEIVICDNDPSPYNETKDLIKRYNNLNIVYMKNSENIGIDRNMIRTIEIASGKYCFWLGDDDIISNESVDKLLSTVENTEFDLILANTSWISEDLLDKGENWSNSAEYTYNDLDLFLKIGRAHV